MICNIIFKCFLKDGTIIKFSKSNKKDNTNFYTFDALLRLMQKEILDNGSIIIDGNLIMKDSINKISL